MAWIKDLLEPKKWKTTLFLMLIIPCTSLILLTFAFLVQDLYYASYFFSLQFFDFLVIAVLMGLTLSYLLGSLLDYFIQSERVKIIIAVFTGIISLLIVYSLYKMLTEPVICDPVHTPNQTICDPVHQPNQEAYSADKLTELDIDVQTVKSSFEECIQNMDL